MTTAMTEKHNRRMKVGDRTFDVTVQLRSVPVNVIKVDRSYQRDVKSDWVQLHLPFSDKLAGAVVLSTRMGGPWCIDGQQRHELARASGVTHINALVIDGLSQSDEAYLFVYYQTTRTNLTSWALFRADRVSGDPQTAAMERCVHAAGFHIAKTSGGGPDAITAIDALRYVHGYGGDDLLGRSLALIGKVWSGEQKALSGQVIRGLALFLHSAGEQPAFSSERLVKVMTDDSPTKVLRLAQQVAMDRNAVNAGPANVAEAIWNEYNQRVPKGQERLAALTIRGKKRPSPYQFRGRVR